MRLPILTAAAIGLAGVSFANAQATNQAPKSGSAETMSNSEEHVEADGEVQQEDEEVEEEDVEEDDGQQQHVSLR